MFTKSNGSGPGLDAPENDYGLTTPHGQPAKIETTNASNYKAKLIATIARFKRTVSGLTFDRGIGIDTILLIVLLLIYAYARWTA
jgi:hypothetical protein